MKIKDYDFPDDLYYTKKHTWARVVGDDVEIGIDSFGADSAGNILFVDLPKPGDKVFAGKSFGHLEADKYVGDLISPMTGMVRTVNEEVMANVEQVKEQPYGRGWLIRVKGYDLTELKKPDIIFGPNLIKKEFTKEVEDYLQ